ncbi:hypothetical protein [Rhizobium grahamii]|uniref:hypothetical protein n=1 Tax=Rhizobium grahamii TaxID=1120045 RepID=UPI001FD5ACAD|nr:hypothetical protein [Rhizobium grahamii]
MAIENFISVRHTEGPQFAGAPEAHVRDYDVDVMNLPRAERLVPGEDYVSVEFANGATLQSRTVIISTGARWRQMEVPGEDLYRGGCLLPPL